MHDKTPHNLWAKYIIRVPLTVVIAMGKRGRQENKEMRGEKPSAPWVHYRITENDALTAAEQGSSVTSLGDFNPPFCISQLSCFVSSHVVDINQDF